MSAELFWGILWAWFASFSLTTTKSFKVNPNLPLLTCYLNNSTNRGEKARILVAIGDRAFTVTLHLYIALCPITSRSSRRIKHFKMRKVDLCLSSEGTEVILATSSDEKHPPENMIDGNPETFWTTTGMFPQEFIICFHKHVRIEKLVIQSYFVRTLRIEKSTSKEPVDFEQWIERDLVHTEGQLQNEEILAHDGHVTYLRFIIVSAFDHFASVHSVSAEGVAVSNLS